MAPLTDEQKACVLQMPAGEAGHAIIHAWQTANAGRDEKTLEYLNGGEKAINHCSELMLKPGAGLARSTKYADNLAGWLRWFPASSIKVVPTELLETSFEDAIAEVVGFLGLKPMPTDVLSDKTRFCVTSKAGIMDEKRSGKERAGIIGNHTPDKHGVAKCDSAVEKSKGTDGVTRYPIDSQSMELLKAFFKPYNRKLYTLLGRDMGWAI